MKIESVPISSLTIDPNNARSHPEKNKEAVKASLLKFKQVEPLVVQRKTGIVIGGNCRLEVMREMNFENVDVHYVDLNTTEATALGIALNRTSELAIWDDDVLGKTLQAIREDGFDLMDIGFDVDDMIDLNIEDVFNNSISDDNESESDKKYLIEIEFPDEQAQKDKYEELISEGLIVRLKK